MPSHPSLSAFSSAARDGLVEVADRVHVARYPACTTCVVAGQSGLLVVDPGDAPGAERLLRDLEALDRPVVAVALTHGHPRHAEAVGALRDEWTGLEVVAHDAAGVPADRHFSSVAVVGLGDRTVELVHPGRGHSAGDAVLRVPDADAVVVGDLLGGHGTPAYGADCFPLDWPATLDLVVGLLTPATVVVPGHGPLLGKDDVEEQRSGVAVVAQTVSDAASRSVGAEALLASTDWPFPVAEIEPGVRRALEQVPRSARRLPLV